MKTEPVNILVVDDDDVDAESVERALQNARILNPLYRAHDGIDALDMLRGHQGKPPIPQPTIILLDINMPRMTGFEFLDELRADPQLHKTVVFMLTTSRDEQDKFEAYERHVAGYIAKSNAGDDFSNLIQMLDQYWRIVEFPMECTS